MTDQTTQTTNGSTHTEAASQPVAFAVTYVPYVPKDVARATFETALHPALRGRVDFDKDFWPGVEEFEPKGFAIGAYTEAEYSRAIRGMVREKNFRELSVIAAAERKAARTLRDVSFLEVGERIAYTETENFMFVPSTGLYHAVPEDADEAEAEVANVMKAGDVMKGELADAFKAFLESVDVK